MVTQGDSPITTTRVGYSDVVLLMHELIGTRKGEELKAPRHASAATIYDDRLPYSQHWQLFFYSCYLYTLIDYHYIKILSKEEEEEHWG